MTTVQLDLIIEAHGGFSTSQILLQVRLLLVLVLGGIIMGSGDVDRQRGADSLFANCMKL
jgi:C4-dicarboxylate transporter